MNNGYIAPFTAEGASSSAHAHVGHTSFLSASAAPSYRGSNVLEAFDASKMRELEANKEVIARGMTLNEELRYMAAQFPGDSTHTLKQLAKEPCDDDCRSALANTWPSTTSRCC